jgi:hypothetical protein
MSVLTVHACFLYLKVHGPESYRTEEKANMSSDVLAYGVVLRTIAKRRSQLARILPGFKKSLLGNRKSVSADTLSPLRRISVQDGYYEEVVTPRILDVCACMQPVIARLQGINPRGKLSPNFPQDFSTKSINPVSSY